jgi:magnesium-transporting ATPase (P-type)
MNPLLLPEYLMEKIRRLSEKTVRVRKGELLNMLILMGLTVTIGVFLSGATYVITYFQAVPWMIDLSSYGYGVYFYIPRALGDYLSQTSLEMIYVLISYLFAGMGVILLVRGSRSVSQKNTIIIFGIVLLTISLLMIVGLDYLKTSALR